MHLLENNSVKLTSEPITSITYWTNVTVCALGTESWLATFKEVLKTVKCKVIFIQKNYILLYMLQRAVKCHRSLFKHAILSIFTRK